MKLLRLFSIIMTLASASAPLWAFQKDPKDLAKNRESWTKLSLDGSEFISVPPLMGQIDTQPLFTRHMIRLQWRSGDPIDTFLIIPKPDAPAVKPAPKPSVIVYLYNYTTNTDRFMLTNVCQNLTMGGVAAVGFSLALSGHRFHDRGATEWFVSNFQEALTTSAHDVQKVIDYLETREDIDTKRIGIFGQGSGAAVAILAAAVDPRIKVLDLEDAWGDWPEWLSKSTIIPEAERAAYLTPAFLKGVEELDPVRHLPKLKIPVRIQYSLPKSAVPPKVRKRMEAALPRQGAHTPVEANFNWIKKQLAEVRSSANSAIAAGSALTASIRGADHTNSRALGRPRRKCSRRSRSALPAATPAAPAAVMCSSVSPSFGIEVSAVRSPSPSNACDNSSAKGPDHSDGYVMRLGVLCAGDDRAAILI